jgi:hypothetical protein
VKRSFSLWLSATVLTLVVFYIHSITAGNPDAASLPSKVNILSSLVLFTALLLSFRVGFEYFNDNQKIKKLTLPAVTFFFFYSIAITPLRKTYELNAINKKVPPITELFDLQSIVLFVLWITAMIVIFNSRNPKFPALIFSIITVLVFLFVRI